VLPGTPGLWPSTAHDGGQIPFAISQIAQVGQLLGITQRTIRVVFGHFKERFSPPRKLIPVKPKTVGDHLLLKRIKANLSRPEMALKARVSEQMVRSWEDDQLLPTEAQWQVLVSICAWIPRFTKAGTQQRSHVLDFTQSLEIEVILLDSYPDFDFQFSMSSSLEVKQVKPNKSNV